MRSNHIVFLAAIMMGGAAAFLARNWVQAQVSASAAIQPAGHIVVAVAPLGYGEPLTSSNLREMDWFANTLPEGAFSGKEELLSGGRRTVLSPLKAGEPVLQSKITGPGQRASLASLLAEGKRALTVRVDDVRGVAGFVLPGDFVDIVMIADEPSNKRQSYSDILLEHVRVLAIDQVAGDAEGKPSVAKAVTVEVTKEQAQKILLATNIGKLSLILGPPIEPDVDPNRRISEGDIGRAIVQPVRAQVPPPPPTPAPVAPPPKVSIIRNGEAKEYSVIHINPTSFGDNPLVQVEPKRTDAPSFREGRR